MTSTIYAGKVAKLIRLHGGSAVLGISDDVTAGDGLSRVTIPGMGLARARQAVAIGRLLKRVVASTFIDGLPFPAPAFLVDPVNKPFKLEVVGRLFSDGSHARLTGIPVGTKLEEPVVEFYLKDDSLHDPRMEFPKGFGDLKIPFCDLPGVNGTPSGDYRVALSAAGTNDLISQTSDLFTPFATSRKTGIRAVRDWFNICRNQTLSVLRALSEIFQRAGHELVDLKLEFGYRSGHVLQMDRITADEFRVYWNSEVGNCYDKEFFRRALRAVVGDVKRLEKKVLEEFLSRYSEVAAFLEEQASLIKSQ